MKASKIHYWWSSSGGGDPYAEYDTDYAAVLRRADALAALTGLDYTIPSASQRAKDNTMVLSWKAGANVWNDLDYLKVTKTDGSQNFATLDWKCPLLYQLILVGNPTFTTNQGFTFNGTNNYAVSAFTPLADGVNYTLNSASFFIDEFVDVGSVGAYNVGCLSGSTALQLISRNAGAVRSVAVNASANSYGSTVSNSAGFYLINRITSGLVNGYFNNVKIGADLAKASSSLPPIPPYIGCQNNGGAPANFRATTFGILGFGANLESKRTELYNAWTTRNS